MRVSRRWHTLMLSDAHTRWVLILIRVYVCVRMQVSMKKNEHASVAIAPAYGFVAHDGGVCTYIHVYI